MFKLSPSQEVLFVVVAFFFLKKNEQNIQPSVFSGNVICNLHMAFEKTSLLPLREWFSKENSFTVLPTLYDTFAIQSLTAITMRKLKTASTFGNATPWENKDPVGQKSLDVSADHPRLPSHSTGCI